MKRLTMFLGALLLMSLAACAGPSETSTDSNPTTTVDTWSTTPGPSDQAKTYDQAAGACLRQAQEGVGIVEEVLANRDLGQERFFEGADMIIAALERANTLSPPPGRGQIHAKLTEGLGHWTEALLIFMDLETPEQDMAKLFATEWDAGYTAIGEAVALQNEVSD